MLAVDLLVVGLLSAVEKLWINSLMIMCTWSRVGIFCCVLYLAMLL
jgi:hypothetical protein